jgi:hypothetical protein
MTNLLKKLTFIMVTALLIAFLLGPPLSFASKLPTVCNIFHKKMTDKAGPCGHRAMFSKIQDNSFEAGAILFSNVGFETNRFTIAQDSHPAFALSIGNLSQTNPLRC